VNTRPNAHDSLLESDAGVSADGRRADAASMTGKRASEGSAATSVNAFELRRITSDVLSHVTDAASS
jgi:hypothetical protein